MRAPLNLSALSKTWGWRAIPLALVPAGLLVLSGCEVPLGPGYQIERQEIELRYVAASPPRLKLRATYQLKNIGNTKLTFLDVGLPDERGDGRENLRAWVDGREVQPREGQSITGSTSGTSDARVPFDPPWPPRQRRSLVFAYDVMPPPPGNARLAVNAGSFHIREGTAFPQLRPPEGFLIEHGKLPRKSLLDVWVPSDFRLYAGEERLPKSRQQAGESQYRFRAEKRHFEPVVVAGQYQQQEIQTASRVVRFWTFEPVAHEQAQVAAERLAGTVETYQAAFGSLGKTPLPVHIVETAGRLTARPGGSQDAAAVALPLSALLNRRAFALGVSSEMFLDLTEHELAHAWFGQAVVPRPEVEPVLEEGLAEYAKLVAAEARGGEAERQKQAALLLGWYDESRKRAADKPLLQVGSGDRYEQRVFAYSKGALFFVALEDRYGKQSVRRALAHLVHSLPGRKFGFAALRSALEAETQQTLGDFFRLWLNQTGIPEEVRARYEVKEQKSATRE